MIIEFPWGRKANDKGPCPRFRRANALLCWEQSGLEPSWAQYTMDPADRISENEEAVKEATPSFILTFILTLRLLASHFND